MKFFFNWESYLAYSIYLRNLKLKFTNIKLFKTEIFMKFETLRIKKNAKKSLPWVQKYKTVPLASRNITFYQRLLYDLQITTCFCTVLDHSSCGMMETRGTQKSTHRSGSPSSWRWQHSPAFCPSGLCKLKPFYDH